MSYLNDFKPNTMSVEEISSIDEFKRDIEISTFIDERYRDKNVDSYAVFDPDTIVLEESGVMIEFQDYKDDSVFKYFEASKLLGSEKSEFTAAEMFYNILKFELDLNEYPAFFKCISYQGTMEYENKTVKVFKAEFGLEN